MRAQDLQKFVGFSLDGLKLADKWSIAGCWIATELYSPQRLPLRIIHAIGVDARACIEQLHGRGLDPTRYEYEPVSAPYVTC
jgi:hypothetical protein